MGHANYSTTLSYTHILEDKTKEEVAKVGKFLWKLDIDIISKVRKIRTVRNDSLQMWFCYLRDVA